MIAIGKHPNIKLVDLVQLELSVYVEFWWLQSHLLHFSWLCIEYFEHLIQIVLFTLSVDVGDLFSFNLIFLYAL